MSDLIENSPSIPDFELHKANEMCRILGAEVIQKEPGPADGKVY